MKFKILTSKIASETFQENIEYLSKNFTIREVNKFIEATEKTITVLKNTPYAFPFWKEKYNYRKVVVVKQISLFFTVSGNYVNILLFWNNKRNPKELEKHL